MPELPEVETTCRGIAPHLLQQTVSGVVVRQPQLRWRVPDNLAAQLVGRTITGVNRRGKYLLISNDAGTVLMHLGMSGSLRLVPAAQPPRKHDHLDIQLSSGQALRFTDPRRFGAVLWTVEPPVEHSLLAHLGPEPLTEAFTGEWLFRRSRRRQVPVKTLVMDSATVVGVGNIYANEALFMAGIRPRRRASRLTRAQCESLVAAIKAVLAKAIAAGGTTLRDFTGGDGKPGYFKQQLFVYGREGQTCMTCASPLKSLRLAQRATVYCPRCQI